MDQMNKKEKEFYSSLEIPEWRLWAAEKEPKKYREFLKLSNKVDDIQSGFRMRWYHDKEMFGWKIKKGDL